MQGLVTAGFEAAAGVFDDVVASTPDDGAGFCVYVEGEKVVDLVGGWADRTTLKPYDHNTIQLTFSCTKGVSALAAVLLIERGLLDPAAPVTTYWPEFGGGRPSRTTVDMLLSHQAGLPTLDANLTRSEVLDGRSAAAALASQAPSWTPGDGHGYHAVTFGFLVGELVRRVDGRSVGHFVRDELAGPLGADAWLGLPAEQEHRVARLHPGAVPPDPAGLAELERFAPGTLPGRAMSLNDVLPAAGRRFAYADRDVRAGELPSANLVCSAAGLARLYSAAVTETDGVRLLGEAAVKAARQTVADGYDRVIGRRTRFGLGPMLPTPEQPMLGPASFGHPGAGGSLGLADPDLRVGLAYTTTALGTHVLADPRASALVDAARSCLGR